METTFPRPLAAALAAASLLLSTGCGPAHAAPAAGDDGAVLVRLAPVVPGPVERPIRAAGVLAAKSEWDLAFKVGGLLARVRVEEGAPVRAGELLAELDTTELAAGVAQAREALAKARRDADRAALLVSADSAPRVAAEDARTSVALAEAALAAAGFNLRHARLVAPDDGWVDRRTAEPGEVVAPGRPVLRLSGSGRGFVVRAALAERDVLGLERGAPATVALDARPGVQLPGRVTEIGHAAARGTGTWQVEVAIDPGPAGAPLLAGLTAKVQIPRSVPAAGAVPLAAVVAGDGAAGAVFAVEGGRARRVPVSIAFLDGDRAVLAGGVEAVEAVVTDGATRLSDGARVRVAR
ncbi:MAG TPA: efflux RND transporter periplasmic adaptor subunit [Anaeromyxobacter sp.]